MIRRLLVLLLVGGLLVTVTAWLAWPSFVPLDMAGSLLLGWVGYLRRVLPKVTIDGPGVLTAVVCLMLFTAGLHAFLRWFQAEVQRQQGRGDDEITRWTKRRTISIVTLVMVMFVAGIAAAGVVHQVGWLMTGETPRTAFHTFSQSHYLPTSEENLKMIGLVWPTSLDYREYHADPATPSANRSGRPLQSWQTYLLRVLPTGSRTTELIDYGRPWNDPRNSAYFRGIVVDYLNPDVAQIRDAQGYALSHFAGNVHALAEKPPRPEEIGQGSANLILCGEVSHGFKPWGDPTNLRDPARGMQGGPEGFGNPAATGAYLAFHDGSVRFFRRTASPDVLRPLSVPLKPSR